MENNQPEESDENQKILNILNNHKAGPNVKQTPHVDIPEKWQDEPTGEDYMV